MGGGMQLRPIVVLRGKEVQRMIDHALANGFKRKHPKRRWNDQERRMFAQRGVQQLVYSFLTRREEADEADLDLIDC